MQTSRPIAAATLRHSSLVLIQFPSKETIILEIWANAHKTRDRSSIRSRVFWREYPNVRLLYARLVEPMGSKLRPFKSAFYAENHRRRLSWSISSDFGAIHSWNREKNHLKPLCWGLKVVEGHRRWYPRKIVSSACYDKQQLCAYLQPL